MNMIVSTPIKIVYSPAYREVALSALYEISKVLAARKPIGAAMQGVASILESFIQMRRGAILLLDAGKDSEAVQYFDGAGNSKSTVPQKAIGRILASGDPFVVDDIAADPLFEGSIYLALAPPHIKSSFIALPIEIDGQVRGVLSVAREWEAEQEFRLDDDVQFLTAIVNMVGQSLRLQNLLEKDGDGPNRRERKRDRPVAGEGAKSPIRGVDDAPVMEGGIVGGSPMIRKLHAQVIVAGRSNATVMLRGETGTGKELFARAIHDHSARAANSFVKVNCAALPESVIESELFGHEKGAFTGAIGQRQGRFELAHKGTLFLDEIGEISPSFQAKLLRVLQKCEFERVGGTRTLKVDVRIVCATNRNLEEVVAKGQFRADLYYRINVVTLILPPLRDRPGDIPDLAELFLERFSAENMRRMRFSRSAMEVISRCAFPGNVRELENCVRRTATLAGDDLIEAGDFACQQGACFSSALWQGRSEMLSGMVEPEAAPAPPPIPSASLDEAEARGDAEGNKEPFNCHLAGECAVGNPVQYERERLISAMRRAGGVQAKAGRLLGMTPRQIGYALRKHCIDISKF
jgi:Nif-specific regulatory protein